MRTKNIVSILLAFLLVAPSCKSEGTTDAGAEFTVIFDCGGGTPVPAPQVISKGGYVKEPEEIPVLDALFFSGWYTQSGLKFNFKSNRVTKNLTLVAHYWAGPKKYIVINDYDQKFHEKSINSFFGDGVGQDVLVGQGVLMYIFQRSLETHVNTLRKHLQEAEENGVPLLIQLDPISFWENVPELWNWFDPNIRGYNEDNRQNVEWTSWSSDDAVKIGWLNWGSQVRLRPMANLFSPAYQAAVKDRMETLIGVVDDWYQSLPDRKKYLLIGIKITGEVGVGVNNWYYTDGNSLYGKDAKDDPTSGIDMYNKPSRSKGQVSTIGYAGCSYAGIRTSGALTGNDIAELERRFTLYVSGIATSPSFHIPREKLFAHAGGVGNDLDACINSLVCPSWSFYGSDAEDAHNATYCLNLVKNSDAPRWAIAEWAVSGNADKWATSLRNAFSIDGCYFLSAYTNVIGNNNGTTVNQEAVQGILTVIKNDKY